MHDNFETPILFLIFNRIETTEKVFNEIKKVKPKKLFIASDGARNPDEEVLVNKVRNLVLNQINWDCEVETLFRDENLGCKYAVSGAISWFFEQVEQGLILEDDCLPSIDFFRYCEELLNRYQGNKNIWHIAGNNYLEPVGFNKYLDDSDSFCLSHFGPIWGWATWSDRWQKYDLEMESFKPDNYDGLFEDWLPQRIKKSRIENFNLVKNGFDTWDFQWQFTKIKNKGLTICPKFNLITNIGFGASATHTALIPPQAKLLRNNEIKNFKNIFPKKIEVNRDWEINYCKRYVKPSILNRITNRLSNFL